MTLGDYSNIPDTLPEAQAETSSPESLAYRRSAGVFPNPEGLVAALEVAFLRFEEVIRFSREELARMTQMRDNEKKEARLAEIEVDRLRDELSVMKMKNTGLAAINKSAAEEIHEMREKDAARKPLNAVERVGE
jgi:hypothetical protein